MDVFDYTRICLYMYLAMTDDTDTMSVMSVSLTPIGLTSIPLTPIPLTPMTPIP